MLFYAYVIRSMVFYDTTLEGSFGSEQDAEFV